MPKFTVRFVSGISESRLVYCSARRAAIVVAFRTDGSIAPDAPRNLSQPEAVIIPRLRRTPSNCQRTCPRVGQSPAGSRPAVSRRAKTPPRAQSYIKAQSMSNEFYFTLWLLCYVLEVRSKP